MTSPSSSAPLVHAAPTAPPARATTDPLLVATRDGLIDLGSGAMLLEGHGVNGAARAGDVVWALTDHREVHRIAGGSTTSVAVLDDGRASVLVVHDGQVWLGGDEARVWRLDQQRIVESTSFASSPTHERWSTPWGGPPAIFSMASHGTDLFVSVHVGGILRTEDDGRTWTPTIDLATDVHQVVVDDDGTVWAATGTSGLARSTDRGATWTFHDQGLHATYALAVAVTSDGPIVSSSSGHSARNGALHRFDGERFERLHQGLPVDLGGAVGPRQLSARGAEVAAALPDGGIVTSDDCGRTWQRLDRHLPGARDLLL